MKLVHKKNIEVQPSQCDKNGRIELHELLDLLQTIAGEHADILHFGIEDLNKGNDTWVLSRLRVEIVRWPLTEEKITLQTWPKGIDRLFAIRDFILTDADNNVIVRAASYWLIVDRITKRPKIISAFFRQIDYPDLSAIDEKLDKIPAVGETEFSTEIKTSEKELDINGHINNVWYAYWFMSALPEELKDSKNISCFEINYIAEVFANETLDVEIGNGGNDTSLLLGSIKRNNREVCRAKIHFE